MYSCKHVFGCSVLLAFQRSFKVVIAVSDLSLQEIKEENERLRVLTKEYNNKATFQANLIEDLHRMYQRSKQYFIVKRYRLLKNMIKHVTQNQWLDS